MVTATTEDLIPDLELRQECALSVPVRALKESGILPLVDLAYKIQALVTSCLDSLLSVHPYLRVIGLGSRHRFAFLVPDFVPSGRLAPRIGP